MARSQNDGLEDRQLFGGGLEPTGTTATESAPMPARHRKQGERGQSVVVLSRHSPTCRARLMIPGIAGAPVRLWHFCEQAVMACAGPLWTEEQSCLGCRRWTESDPDQKLDLH